MSRNSPYLATLLAKSALDGQVDFGQNPYMQHVASVTNQVAWLGSTDVVCAAILHDVIERHRDSNWATRVIAMRFNPAVYNAVFAVTRGTKQDYEEHLNTVIRGGVIPIAVKIAECTDNLNVSRILRCRELTVVDTARMDDYRAALWRLHRAWYQHTQQAWPSMKTIKEGWRHGCQKSLSTLTATSLTAIESEEQIAVP